MSNYLPGGTRTPGGGENRGKSLMSDDTVLHLLYSLSLLKW